MGSNDEIARLKEELHLKDLELKKTQIQRNVYKRMIEIAESEYAIPIRKNSGAK